MGQLSQLLCLCTQTQTQTQCVCASSILTKAHLTGGDVETGNLRGQMWRQQIKDKNWYFLYYKKETAFNLFGVVVNYCRVFPLSIANLSTKLDAGERERKWVESISGLTALTGHCLEMNPSEKRFFNNLYQKKRQLYLTKWTIVSNIIMWLMTYICTTKGCSNTRCTKMYNISQFFTSTPHLTYFLQHLNSTLWRRKLWSQTKQKLFEMRRKSRKYSQGWERI